MLYYTFITYYDTISEEKFSFDSFFDLAGTCFSRTTTGCNPFAVVFSSETNCTLARYRRYRAHRRSYQLRF